MDEIKVAYPDGMVGTWSVADGFDGDAKVVAAAETAALTGRVVRVLGADVRADADTVPGALAALCSLAPGLVEVVQAPDWVVRDDG